MWAELLLGHGVNVIVGRGIYCTIQGGGILYVKRCHHEHMKPLVISHGFGCGFTPEFMWSGE